MNTRTTDTVSLVMIVRNGERFLPDALASAQAQTRAPDEIVVVDGGSVDGTVAIAESHGVRVTQQPGRGIGDARNHGVQETSGALIAFLDCDDRWLPTKLDRQVQALIEHSDAQYSLTMLDTVADDEAAVHPNNRAVLEREPVLGWTPSALLARRSLFDDVGPFDTELGVGVDMDFFARLIDAGVPSANIDDVLVHKRIHDRNESVDVASNTRDMLRVARRSIERRSRR